MKGWSSRRQIRRGGMLSAGRSVFWYPLVRAERDSCERNGQWKGLIFRHNRVHVQNQGAVLRKSRPRGVHPVHFPARQGENERRPISLVHFTLDENGYHVVSPNEQGAPCCVVYPLKNYNAVIRRIFRILIVRIRSPGFDDKGHFIIRTFSRDL